MKQNTSRGFSLIELLMVVMIFSMLLAITILAVASARNKATDKAILTNMVTVRNQAQLYYDGVGAQSYGNPSSSCLDGLFANDPVIVAAIAKLQTYTDSDHVVCSNATNAFAIASQLKTTNDYYCLDSVSGGKITLVDNAPDGLVGAGTRFVINTLTSLCN